MPVLDVIFSMLVFFLFIAWIWVLISVIGDIFRSDMGGAAKAIWVLFVMLLPWLGVLIYLISNGDAMADRTVKQAVAMEEAQRAYIRDAAGTASPADELAKLSGLKDSGAITDEEYQKLRAQVIG
ncbi:MAG: SHOCT domain-containing protein [Acidimicrobiia bacterium]|nr:SHOCT domain-containing protein [Acidimicrobiia bacterium]